MQDFRFADMHIQAPETPGRFSLRLGVYPPAQVLQLNGCCCHCTPASHVVEGVTNRRVPSLHGHYPASALLRPPPSPSRLRLISRGTGYTTYLASADFAAGRGGSLQLLGVSLSPCCRSHPAGVVRRVSQSATAHTAFAFTVAGSASGAPHFRGHLCVRLRYGLETRPHPTDEAVERLQKVGFPSPCSPSYRALAFPLVGLPPTEHASLSWTHNRTYHLHGIRLSTCGLSPCAHEAFLPLSPAPQYFPRGQLARALGTSGPVFPQARGLRHASSSSCGQLSCPQTTMPHPTLPAGIELS